MNYKFPRNDVSFSAQSGLTLIELIVVLTIVALLFTLSTVNLTPLIPKANVTQTADQIVADIKHQQIKAMVGVAPDAETSAITGVFIGSDQYTLFSGSSYQASDPTNYRISLPGNTTLTTSFPGNQLVFTPGSGEIVGATGMGSITISDTSSGQARTIIINQLGVIERIE